MNERAHVTAVAGEQSKHHADAPGRKSASAGLSAPLVATSSGILMRKATDGSVPNAANAEVERAVSAGGGRGLPSELRDTFETSLGTDLSAVRIHEGADSHAAAASVSAKAFTVGNDIHFGAGQFNPGTAAGQHLLAHEVAHTVQQRGGSPTRQNKLTVSSPGDNFETAADAAADAMVVGAPHSLGGAVVGLARAEEPGAVQQGVQAAQKAGANGDRKLKAGSTGISLGGKTGTIKWSPEKGIEGSLALGAGEASLGKKLAKDWFIPVGGVGGYFLKVAGGVSVSAEASAKLQGSASSGDSITGTFSGLGSVGFKASGRVTAGGFIGAPIANLHGGGYLEITGGTTAEVQVSGSVTVKDNGNGAPVAIGKVSLAVEPKVSIIGSGGITVGYNAVVTSGDLYEHELGQAPIAEVAVPVKSTYDFSTGQATNEGKGVEVKYLSLTVPSARKVLKSKFGNKAESLEKSVRDAKQAEDGHLLEHGVDVKNQQSHQPDPNFPPEDCTDPKDLDVKAPESVPGEDTPGPARPKVKTWVDQTG